MDRFPLASVVLLILSLAACGQDFELQTTELETNASGNLEIIVSNQSFEIDAVDVHIRIDGKVAISDVFHVEGQHTFVAHTFQVAPGSHELAIETDVGDAELTASIETTADKRWATVMFWYYPEGSGGDEPTPRQFSFNASDEQPLFD